MNGCITGRRILLIALCTYMAQKVCTEGPGRETTEIGSKNVPGTSRGQGFKTGCDRRLLFQPHPSLFSSSPLDIKASPGYEKKKGKIMASILIINPNSTAAMTDALRPVVDPLVPAHVTSPPRWTSPHPFN